jgi:hypothetical protein
MKGVFRRDCSNDSSRALVNACRKVFYSGFIRSSTSWHVLCIYGTEFDVSTSTVFARGVESARIGPYQPLRYRGLGAIQGTTP